MDTSPSIPTPAIDLELKRKEQNDILAELESIQDLLNGADPEHIPVLSHSLEADTTEELDLEFEPALLEEAVPTLEAELRDEDATLSLDDHSEQAESGDTTEQLTAADNAQQSELFEPQVEKSLEANKPQDFSRPAKAVKASGENPFLPQHIRERLNSQSYKKSAAEAAGAQDQQAPDHAETKLTDDADHYQEIIDKLVAEYLPELEKALREKLKALLDSSSE